MLPTLALHWNGNKALTGVGFQPDWVWLGKRQKLC